MKRLLINILFFTLVITVGFALYYINRQQDLYFNTILKSTTSNLRDVKIGSSPSEVKTKEDSSYLLDDMEDYLHYDYKLDTSNSYTVSYDFSENMLYEVEISIYLNEIKDAKILFNSFVEFFNQSHGKHILSEDKYFTWTSSSGSPKEYLLKEESLQYGFVSIKVRDLNFYSY